MHILKAQGCEVNQKQGFKINLRRTKTDQFSSTTVRIQGNGKFDCPVYWLKLYMQEHRGYPGGPLFAYRGVPLTGRQFNLILKRCLYRAGLNPSLYASHSLRSGAATTAAEKGVPEWLIQKLGRWKSGCYKIYILTQKRQNDKLS